MLFSQENRKILIRFFCIFTLGVFTGIYVRQILPFSQTKCNLQARFINPYLTCNTADAIAKHSYAKLRKQLIDYFEIQKKENHLIDASVFFRDLHNGPVMGINDEMKFVPASLLKVPLLLTYLRLAEERPEILKLEIGFRGKYDNPQSFQSPITLEENKPYRIEELLTNSIKHSDNQSNYILREYLKKINPNTDELLTTYRELGIIEPKNTLEETITVRSYSSIFRMLYHVSYFSLDMSEKALDLMSRTTFNKGIVAGVPKDMIVSHKFGERYDLPDEQKQLHDCGIVYYPKNPYLLCVMTRGRDVQKQAEIIAYMSKMVYEEVDSRKISR